MDEDSYVKNFLELVPFDIAHSSDVSDFHDAVQVKVSIVA